MEINFYQWPFVVLGSESGTMWRPLNIGVVYGLGVAVFLTLFLIPTIYYLHEKDKRNPTNIRILLMKIKKQNKN